MRITPPRYIVGIPSKRICYEGTSRARAWLNWVLYRRSGAIAFDRRGWVINPSYWLRGETPGADFFSPAVCLKTMPAPAKSGE